MNQLNDKTRTGPENRTGGQRLLARLPGLPRAILACLVGILPAPAFSQADEILTEARDYLATAMEVGFWILLAAGYGVAGYMIIMGVVRLIQGRDGGVGQFAVGIVVAIVMLVLMTLFITAGQEQIEQIRSG